MSKQYNTEVKPNAIDKLSPLTKEQIREVAEAAKEASALLIAIDPVTNPDGYGPPPPVIP
jgi:hypothetical protein